MEMLTALLNLLLMSVCEVAIVWMGAAIWNAYGRFDFKSLRGFCLAVLTWGLGIRIILQIFEIRKPFYETYCTNFFFGM